MALLVERDELAGDVFVLMVLGYPFPQQALVARMLLDLFGDIQAGDGIPKEALFFPRRTHGAAIPAVLYNGSLEFKLAYNLFEVVGCHGFCLLAALKGRKSHHTRH
jgi:hypothetical protein